MNVLVAVDMEPGSDKVIELGAELVQSSGGSLVVLHVVTPDEAEEREHIPGASRYADVMVEDVERDLITRVEDLGLTPSAVETVARFGSFVDEVGEAARRTGAAVIVVGMRRRSRVGKFLLGSDLQDLLLATDRPVVTVPIDREPG